MKMSVSAGGVEIPVSQCPFRCAIFGESGSGKSSLYFKMMEDKLRLGFAVTAIDQDDVFTNWARDRMRGTNVPVYSVSLKYDDSTGFHFGKMLSTEVDRIRFTWKVIKDNRGDSQPYWNSSARLVYQDAIETLVSLAGDKFTLADTIRLGLNPRLHTLLSVKAGLGRPYRLFGKSRRDVVATMASKLKPLSVYAAMDEKCKSRIDLPLRRGVLVLEASPRYLDCLSAVYSFLADWLVEALLEERSPILSTLAVDEIQEFDLQCFRPLARRGRKSNVSVVATAHEYAGLQEKMGDKAAEEFIGHMSYKLMLRCGSPSTAKLLSSYLGETESVEDLSPRSTDGSAKAYGRKVTMRQNVLPDEIRQTPLPDWENDQIAHWFDTPGGSGSTTCSFRSSVTLTQEPDPRPRLPAGHQTLGRMQPEHLDNLGIKVTNLIIKALK